jgi:hypothetical protein
MICGTTGTFHVDDKRVLHICRVKDIKFTIKYANRGCTRQAKEPRYLAENLLNRQFYAERPDEKWLTDVTEFKWYEGTEAHKVYLSAILDLCEKRIVAYVIGERNVSVIVALDLKICLGMIADRADLRSLGADMNMSAVAAHPDLLAVLGEYLALLKIFEKLKIALFVGLLYGGYHAEFNCDLLEALGLGYVGKSGVHGGPLIIFAGGCGCQIFFGVVYAAVDVLIPHLGVFFFVSGGLVKNGCDLLKTVFARLTCVPVVLVAGHGFAGQSRAEIVVGLRSLEFCHNNYLLKKFVNCFSC